MSNLFIEDYNAPIDKLNSLIEEDTDYREYAPLTDAQKKREMSEKEIELWEEKAKRGFAAHDDSTISTFLQQMRSGSISVRRQSVCDLRSSVSKTGEEGQKASRCGCGFAQRRFAQLLRESDGVVACLR